ncbi:MAG: hypothetical protein DBY35_12905 [Bacteroidales bacterium]|nr:MAG: hypothetical protein DBY35_12905 [Bacteroidales bacterium]
MNKTQNAIQYLEFKLLIFGLVCVSLVSFTACSDDDEPVVEVTYSWEFEEVAPSTPDFMDDKNKIESAFKTALGASCTATSVTKQGTSETCDLEVLEACQRAFDSLKDEVWQGRYTFTVTNVTTGIVIFSLSFDADDNNSAKSYQAYDLKIGDYIYDDGTTSDGGLRGIEGDGSIVWAEPRPQPEGGKTVVGVVFWTPSETTAYGRITPASLTDDKIMSAEHPDCIHGLAVAVKNLTYNGRENMRWQKPDDYVTEWQLGEGFAHAGKDKFVPISSYFAPVDNINRIYGYQNTVILRAYNAYCNANGRSEYIVCPVAALDEFVSGNVCPAPAGSTGWFLPSVKELHMLCCGDLDNVWLRRVSYHATTIMKVVYSSIDAVGGDAMYIRYWSSSELENSSRAFGIDFCGYATSYSKYFVCKARAVCAF